MSQVRLLGANGGCTPYATEKKETVDPGTHLPGQENVKCLKMRMVRLQGGHAVGRGHVQRENTSWAMVDTTAWLLGRARTQATVLVPTGRGLSPGNSKAVGSHAKASVMVPLHSF